jgi:hypothetical protein
VVPGFVVGEIHDFAGLVGGEAAGEADCHAGVEREVAGVVVTVDQALQGAGDQQGLARRGWRRSARPVWMWWLSRRGRVVDGGFRCGAGW